MSVPHALGLLEEDVFAALATFCFGLFHGGTMVLQMQIDWPKPKIMWGENALLDFAQCVAWWLVVWHPFDTPV